MKSIYFAAAAALPLTAGAMAADAELKSDKDKYSYAIGVDAGTSLKNLPIEIDPALVSKGLTDTLTGAKALLSEEQLKEVFAALQKDIQSKMMAREEKAAGENKTASEKFLADNKAKDGVKTTASGLQYKVVKEGTGDKPKATDKVTVHYKGTLISGTEFDSSYKRNEPVTFALNQVIPGWTEGLQLMTPGSKYQLYIPSNLAYGEQAPPTIGPNQALIFDVELLKVEAGDAPEAAPKAE